MDSPYHSATAAKPASSLRPNGEQDGIAELGFAQLMGSATLVAHEAGKRVGLARRWVEETALEKYPLTTLGMAFGLGVFAGWFVKRR